MKKSAAYFGLFTFGNRIRLREWNWKMESGANTKEVLTPKNVYRFLTDNLPGLYPHGVIPVAERKGLTLVKFWAQVLDGIIPPEWHASLFGGTQRSRRLSDMMNRTGVQPLPPKLQQEMNALLSGETLIRLVQMQAAQNVAPDFREAFISYCDLTTLAQRLKENPNLTLEFRDPKEKVYLMTTLPQNYDRRGRLESVLMVTQDVTAEKERERDYQLQLKKTAEDAERANIVKTDFLRRMSHDIRTPINGIRGMVEISRRYVGDEAKQEECREKIMTASGFLLDLVNDVLNMNKLESGAVTLEEKPFNLRQMVSEIVTMVEGQAWHENVQVSCKTLAWNHENLIGSPMHLHQVLQNVVGNAVKYNCPGGSVTISCEEKGFDGTTATFLFTCADTGRGMSAAFQQHAFEAFAQEESGARTAYKGTGLGLPIAKELVEQMGGKIHFESELGVGTTFYITLPFRVDPNPPEAESAKPEQAASIKGAHILLVEDNELNMEISQYILEGAGAIVAQAWNGKEAVRRFSESEPGTFDCILMDVMMPLMDGLEATRTIRAMQRPDAATIPIVAMTANTFSEDEQRSREAGMNLFLNKPVDSVKMLQTVLECLKMGGENAL